MSATILNLTDLPDEDVLPVVVWTLDELGANISCFAVRVLGRETGIHGGRFYGNPRDNRPRVWLRDGPFPPAVQHFANCWIPYWPTEPVRKLFASGPDEYWPETWEECLVCITAHEGYHFLEYLNPSRTIRWSELMAEWIEHEAWLKWNERRTSD